jgi:signal transduction histidine kinase
VKDRPATPDAEPRARRQPEDEEMSVAVSVEDPAPGRATAPRVRWIDVYVIAVSAAGLLVLAMLIAAGGLRELRYAPATFWVLGVLAVVGELFPVRLPRRDDVEEITTSTTFGFAIMLGWGTTAAVIAMAVAVLAADLGRKQLWKVLFNLSAYVLATATAGGVYVGLGGTPDLFATGPWPVFAAGFAFFLVNTAVIEVAVALSQGLPPLHHFRQNLEFQALAAGVLLCLAPVVVVLAQDAPELLPLLVLPVASVHWGARESIEKSELAELNRLKDDLIAVVSHELRTPLTSIQGYVKTLLQLGDRLDAAQSREFLEGAARQSDRLQRLIEELLVAARLDADVESLELSPLDAPALAERVVDELRERASGHTLILDFDPDPEPLRTDVAKVHRILSNLVENALKYTPESSTIAITGRASVAGLVIRVEDDGPGIPHSAGDRVFERFFQVDQSATRRVGGTGLGLYICRRLAETIGGDLTLERSTPEGSVFSLLVPWQPPRPAAGRALPAAVQSLGLPIVRR